MISDQEFIETINEFYNEFYTLDLKNAGRLPDLGKRNVIDNLVGTLDLIDLMELDREIEFWR